MPKPTIDAINDALELLKANGYVGGDIVDGLREALAVQGEVVALLVEIVLDVHPADLMPNGKGKRIKELIDKVGRP